VEKEDMKAPIFEADKVDGKIKWQPQTIKALNRWVSTFKDGTHFEIKISQWHKVRTDDQREYYFAVVIRLIAKRLKCSEEDAHEEMKLEFNPVQSKLHPGRIIGGSTKKMNTIEFFSDENSYVERICRYWAENGLYIPPPEKKE
jgi:hypothetical protein